MTKLHWQSHALPLASRSSEKWLLHELREASKSFQKRQKGSIDAFVFSWTFKYKWCLLFRLHMSKNIQSDPCGILFSGEQNRTTKQMCKVCLKYTESNGWSNNLKIASFPGFFENVAFEIQRRFLASWAKFKFCS